MEERRLFKRTGYEGHIRLNRAEEAITIDSITRLVNISGGGIRITSPQPLAADQHLALEINIPGYMKSISVRGQVVWTTPAAHDADCLAGIQFTKIDSYDRQLILDYVHFGSEN